MHEQGAQALGRTKIAGEQTAIRINSRHQGDAPKVVPLGDHLCADQDIDRAAVHIGQMLLQAVFAFGAVGIHARYAHGLAVGAQGVG